MNAFEAKCFELFDEELFQKKINEDIKVIILKGAGKTSFCTGGDFSPLFTSNDSTFNFNND